MNRGRGQFLCSTLARVVKLASEIILLFAGWLTSPEAGTAKRTRRECRPKPAEIMVRFSEVKDKVITGLAWSKEATFNANDNKIGQMVGLRINGISHLTIDECYSRSHRTSMAGSNRFIGGRWTASRIAEIAGGRSELDCISSCRGLNYSNRVGSSSKSSQA